MSDLFDINVKSPVYEEDGSTLEEDSYNYDVYNTTLENEAELELEEYDSKYTSEHPSSTSEVNDTTLSMMFGDSWNGSYIDVTSLVGKAAEKLAWEMTLYSSFSDFLNKETKSALNDAYLKTGMYQMKLNAKNAETKYKELTDTFTNFKSFGYISGSSNILNSTDSILYNMESSISSVYKMSDKVDEILNSLKNQNNLSEKEIDTIVNKSLENIKDILSQQNLSNLLSSFPQSIVERFMGVDVVQELYTMPLQVYKKITSIVSILSSIQAPENKYSVLKIIKLLRSVVADMKNVTTMLSNGLNKINTLKSNIQSGNYIGVFLTAKNACKFVEKTSQYAAQYPYNLAHETEAGHIFETDNTPGKERLHVQHCSGTDVEISPSGDMVSKVKKDCQFIVENDFQNHVKGNQLMLVDKISEVQSKTMKMTATEDLNVSSKATTFTTDTMVLMSDTTLMSSQENFTIVGNSSGSVSCNGPLYLSSTSQVIIDAPSIIIGEGRANLITLNSTGNIISNSSGANIINSPMTNINSDSVFVGEGIIKMNGFITLN